MRVDQYGQQIYNEQDLCDLYLTEPDRVLRSVLVEKPILFNSMLGIENAPRIVPYEASDKPVQEFDIEQQHKWFIPLEYTTFDIATFVLEQCDGDAELQRAGQELILYQERDMFMLLRYLKYLVDTMRKHNIVWGVGRGSSVSSFVLYLIGVHKINALYYDLDISEFLK
jgi:hypothetical protein